MPIEQVHGLIGYLGLLFQTASAFLLLVLFYLLRRKARRKTYFGAWGDAWAALAVALVALVARYYILPGVGVDELDDNRLWLRALYAIYQFFKLLFVGLLLTGALRYAHGLDRRLRPAHAVLAAGVYTALSVGLSSDLHGIVAWQAPVVVASLASCAVTLLSLPPSRRSLGSRVTGALFALVAAHWLGYMIASDARAGLGASFDANPLMVLIHYNSYFDLLLQMLLGYGMLLVLMEDVQRETADAHSELAVAHDRLKRLAFYDPLTGLLNRRAYTERVGLERARATFGTAVVLDMDNLKAVNDTYGHAAGDEIIRYLAETLRAGLRVSDKLYRWGGDEFLLLMPGARAARVRPRLEALIRRAAPLRVGPTGEEQSLRVSLGAADYTGAEDIPAAIDRADAAMYLQKGLGRHGSGAGSVPGR